MKPVYLYLSLLGCFFSAAAIAQPYPEAASTPLFFPKNDAEHPCLSDQDYEVITARCAANQQAFLPKTSTPGVPEAVTLFNWPLKAASNNPYCSFYGITAQVDQDQTAGIRDYNCGSRTYNGHGGTDIGIWPFPFYMMDSNMVEVIAAAAGTIIDKHDGEFDKNCVGAGSGLTANYVVIQHADGSRALYLHMKNGSITLKAIGQPVAQGELLGRVGSSGSSSGPHLHFEVWAGSTSATRVDPFQGPCNTLNATSWWAMQPPYLESAIVSASVHTAAPVFPPCPATETPNEGSCYAAGSAATFAVFYRNEVTGLVSNMSIKNPDGTTFTSWTRTSNNPNNYGLTYFYSNKTLPANVAGTFTFEASYNGSTCSRTFDIGYAKITAAGPTTICPGSTVTLNANTGTGLTYQWRRDGVNVGTNNAALAANAAGAYTVIVTTAHGCSATSAPVSVALANAPSTTITGNPAFCAGGSTTLNAGAGFSTYAWNTGANTAGINAAQGGTYTVTVSNAQGCTGSATATVTVNPLPQPSISGNLSFCTGGSTTLNAGAGFAAYAWNTGANTSSISTNQAGTYTVTVTNAQGCTASTTASVTVNPLPQPSISGNLSFCTGGSTTLNAGAGFAAYAWSTGANTAGISTNQAGTYTVTVTNAQGCTASTTASVTVNPLPQPSISGNLSFCAGGSTTLNAGTGFAAYAWSTGANTAGISTNQAGTYTVTVTNAQGCTASTAASVTVNPLPQPSISGNLSFCAGGSTTLNAGAGFASYAWNTGANTAGISANQAGAYSVTVTNAQGCTASTAASVTVNPLPQPSISGNLSFCAGSSTTLNAGAGFAAYAWNTGANTASISADQAGAYSVTVSNAQGCTGTATAAITVDTLPEPYVFGNLSFCTGGSTTLHVAGAFSTYAWSNGANTPDVTINQAGIFTLTVTDGQGCKGSAGAEVKEFPLPQPGIAGNPAFCAGSSTTLTTGPGFTAYLWNTGANTPFLSVDQPGLYTVSVIDSHGCSGSAEAVVVANALPAIDLGGDVELQSGSQVALHAEGAGLIFLWSTGETTPTIVVSAMGVYSVTVTDANGCTATDEVSVTVVTAAFSAEEAGSLTISPNPTSDVLNITCRNAPLGACQLFDPLGRLIYENPGPVPAGSVTTISLSHQAPGSYFLRLMSKGKVRTVLLIRQ